MPYQRDSATNPASRRLSPGPGRAGPPAPITFPGSWTGSGWGSSQPLPAFPPFVSSYSHCPPPVVVADALGYHDKPTTRLCNETGGRFLTTHSDRPLT